VPDYLEELLRTYREQDLILTEFRQRLARVRCPDLMFELPELPELPFGSPRAPARSTNSYAPGGWP
jgi:hypothetical protein